MKATDDVKAQILKLLRITNDFSTVSIQFAKEGPIKIDVAGMKFEAGDVDVTTISSREPEYLLNVKKVDQ